MRTAAARAQFIVSNSAHTHVHGSVPLPLSNVRAHCTQARGLDFSAADNDGWTPAHTLVQQQNVHGLRLLHALGVPLNEASVIRKGTITCKVTAETMLDPNGEPLKVQPGMEGVAQTPADMAVGPMLLELYNLGAIEEAELRRRLEASGEIYLLELYNQLRASV